MVPAILSSVLEYFVVINLALMLFNFIPIPPLDGAKVLYAFLDPRTAYQIRPVLEQYGFLILIVLIIPLGAGGSILGRLFVALIGPLSDLLVGRPLIG